MSGVYIGSLVRRLEGREPLVDRDREALMEIPAVERLYASGAEIHGQWEEPGSCTLVLNGWVAAYAMLPDGERQILQMGLPGELPDIGALHQARRDAGLCAIGPCRVALVPCEALRALTEGRPAIWRAVAREVQEQAAIGRAWLTATGRRCAGERLPHLLCEIYLRAEGAGLAADGCMELPLTQADLADATGITAVHVNRILQEMRGEGLIEWRGRRVRLPDMERLRRRARFDGGYLSVASLAAGRDGPEPSPRPWG